VVKGERWGRKVERDMDGLRERRQSQWVGGGMRGRSRGKDAEEV